MNRERKGEEQEDNLLKIDEGLITMFSEKFGLTQYQIKRVKKIVNNPAIQKATEEYSHYMAGFRVNTKVTERYKNKGFRILHCLRDVINEAHPITIAQSEIYYVAVSVIEHTHNHIIK